MRHPRQVPPSTTKRERLLPPASQPSSSFAPSPFCCSRVGRLRFKGDSILFQRQMCYLLLCVVSFRFRRERNAAAAAASDVQVKRRQLLARSPTANSSEISTSDQVRPPFLQRVALTMPGIHRARATLNVECGQDCKYFAYVPTAGRTKTAAGVDFPSFVDKNLKTSRTN